ncbi:hypothetical protein RHSIM_Rhsim01G0126300 [Rhododendron simsii]|uniref:Uncharacterized protein n=1 Tax=Rhododendron simsii TaxID=118357 RepID=A0A834HF69_RHOSS|nr:hypothetical protein RHSIM_Rhsim01G0126300 [Rhododendron simsii]
MTQKANLFKGQQKRKSIPPSRHGKIPVTRKGKRVVKPSKVTKEMDADRVSEELNVFQMKLSSITLDKQEAKMEKMADECLFA